MRLRATTVNDFFKILHFSDSCGYLGKEQMHFHINSYILTYFYSVVCNIQGLMQPPPPYPL